MYRGKILELFTKKEIISAGEIQKEISGGYDFDVRDEIWLMIRDNLLELTPSFQLRRVYGPTEL